MTESSGYQLISSESHVVEPPEVFAALPAALRDRAPKLGAHDGGSAWLVDGAEPIPLPATASTGSGWHRAADGPGASGPVTWEAVLPSLKDPAARVAAQWADSVDAEVLYPTSELWDAIRGLGDGELQDGLVRAYNDWLAGFCAHAPERLVGLAKLPTTSVEAAEQELRRAVGELGLRGAILDTWPSGAPAGGNPDDDPFWAAVDELHVPVSLHYGCGPSQPSTPPEGIAPGMKPPAADAVLPMVAGGVFDRFPDVKVVFAHADAGWALHWMEFFDINYVRQKHLSQYVLQREDAVPSDYIRTFCWFTFHQDRSAVKNRHRLGQVHLLWASHFPYEDAHWPDDRQQAMNVAEELPPADRQALLADNVGRLYGLPGYEKGFRVDEVEAFEQLVHF